MRGREPAGFATYRFEGVAARVLAWGCYNPGEILPATGGQTGSDSVLGMNEVISGSIADVVQAPLSSRFSRIVPIVEPVFLLGI